MNTNPTLDRDARIVELAETLLIAGKLFPRIPVECTVVELKTAVHNHVWMSLAIATEFIEQSEKLIKGERK